MTRAFTKIAFTVCLLWVSYLGNAHGTIGFISTSVVNTNVALGDTIFINTKLVNYDDHPFIDSLSFNLAVNNILVTDPTVFTNPLQNQLVNIPGGDSIPLLFVIVAKPSNFIAGPNGLVIWPALGSVDTTQAHDIISAQINVRLTGIEEQIKTKALAWASNKTLYIISQGGTEQVSELRIFDLMGREIYNTQKSWPFEIPTSVWTVGIYIADIRLKSGEKIALKINIQ